MKSRHFTNHPATCPHCLTYAKVDCLPGRTPLETIAAQLDQYTKRHKKAMTRRAKDRAMQDCGLVRVRGTLGGIYWE